MVQNIYSQIVILFSLMAVGYVLGKIHFITAEELDTLSKMTTKVAIPCFLMSTMFIEVNPKCCQMIIEMLVYSIPIYLTVILLSYLAGRIITENEQEKKVYTFACMFANSGFNGFPIIEAVYGKEALLVGNVFNVVINLLVFTVGIQVYNCSLSLKDRIKKCINPGIIGGVAGIVLFLLKVKLPGILETSIRYVGDMCIPLSMITVGIMLCDVPVLRALKNIRMHMVALFRLIVIPLIVFILSKWIFMIECRWIILVPSIMLAMPAAMVTALFSKEYNSDYKSACQVIFVTTLYSGITIPMVLNIMDCFMKV